MADIDLRFLPADEFVLHFGGRPNEVDAFTFSNSLVAFAEALQEINRQVNANFSIEIALEGVGPGSFRAKIKTKLKALAGLFSGDLSRDIIVGILSAAIYEKAIQPLISTGSAPIVIVNDDSVIIESGNDRIIVPRDVHEARKKLKAPATVDHHISRAFSVLEADPSIESFGLAHGIRDPEPVGLINRDRFAILTREVDADQPDNKRHQDVNAKLVILKAVFERSPRLWQFVWNGVRISASIKDTNFFDRLARREYSFTQGDVLDVLLRVHQVKDEMSSAFINERYEILQVRGVEPALKQHGLL